LKDFVAVALFLFSASLTAQVEHGLTAAQCQVDQHLWFSQIENRRDNRLVLPDFYTLLDETKEMDACQKIDPLHWHVYYNTSAEMDAERLGRYMNFVRRHGLYEKFIMEDRAGMR
jgi:hypothetical protein